jgi:hypothetical protein
MAEPTLLQQAREQLEGSHAPLAHVESHVRRAVQLILQHLEQQQAATSGPAQEPSEPRCRVCGEARSFGHGEEPDEHSYGDGDHDFEPETPDEQQLRGKTDAPDASALDLDALQRLCDAATPAKWCLVDQGTEIVDAYQGRTICELTDVHDAEHDGAFICAAREALPKLIAKVRELQSQLEAARPIVATHKLRTGDVLPEGEP